MSVWFLPQIERALGPGVVAWVIAGGLLYTVGALAYALRRPDPWPAVFGYHEIFHAFVIGAAACHFVAVALVLSALAEGQATLIGRVFEGLTRHGEQHALRQAVLGGGVG